MLGKFLALAYLTIVVLIPLAIVVSWHQAGAIWVTGYIAGIVTVPLIGIGALRAMSELFEDSKAFVAFIVFGSIAIVISFAAAGYTFL